MKRTVVSVREIQRNYRKLIDEVKRTKHPLFLGARLEPEAVLLPVEKFEELERKANGTKKSWRQVKKTLEWIRAGGKKNVNLARFIHADRQHH